MPVGSRLPRHTDSAEETVVVTAGTLRFVAVYASPDVVLRYDYEVQPDGAPERQTVG